jgi:hypothetical protein
LRSNLLYEVYGSLIRYGIVDSESEFSELFLGKSECFLRTLRHQRREPHLGIYAICQSRLQAAAHQLASHQRYQHIGQELEVLAGRCREIVNQDAVEFDLPA